MATKETLEAREAECSTPEDYVALAREALAEPADAEYAKDLLEKGELECQFPGQYVAVAEAAHEAGLEDYAGELYEQAEDACFEAAEFAILGRSLGAVKGDKEKARELLEKAAEETKGIAEVLKVSQFVREALEDEEMARNLLEKVAGDCQTLEDYQKLASSVLQEVGDAGVARAFFQKASRLATDIDSTIAYAAGAADLLDDKAWTAEILEEVETDCQFTKEFVALAGAYHRLTGDADKVGELMGQAEELAMTGEEQVQLAEGAWQLLQDRDKARAAYEKALGEITGKDELFGLAATIAKDLEDMDLAKQVYAKAEEKLVGVADACKLARAAKDDLGDETFASEVYDRATERFSAPADAGVLAKDVLEVLGDKERAERLYGACLSGTEGFGDLGKLLDTVREIGSEALNRAVVEKLAANAADPTEYLSVADRAVDVMGDSGLATRMLDDAEERVATLPEMKAVVEAVGKHASDDTDRVARVAEKLEKREANQSRYEEFQKREAEVKTGHQHLDLVDEMMAALDDRYYAAKLLGAAERALGSGVFVLDGYERLVKAVEDRIGDTGGVTRLLDVAGERVGTFAEMRGLARVATQGIRDKKLGGDWARAFLEKRAESLGASAKAGVYDFTKMAGGVLRDLGDKAWAGKLLAEAEGRATKPFEIRHVAQMLGEIGDDAKAAALLGKALKSCSTGDECISLVSSLRDQGLPEAELRKHFEACGSALGDPREKMRWAQGILSLFGDEGWARHEYRDLASSFAAPADQARFVASQKVHFGERFC